MNDDGEPAYPIQGHCVDASGAYCGDVVHAKGMTLRDYFAGQAMLALATDVINSSEHGDFSRVARDAYSLADAMLKERDEA